MTDKKRKLNTIELTIEKPAPKRAKTHSLSSEPLPRRVSDTSSHSQNYRNKPHKIPSQNSTFGVKQKGKAIDLEKIISDLAKYFDEKWSTSSNHEQQHIQREDERFHETLRRCLQKVRSSCLDPRFVPGPRWRVEALRAQCPSLQHPTLTVHLYTNGFVLNDQTLLHPYELSTTDMQDAINWGRLVPPLSVLLEDLSAPPAYFHGGVLIAVHDHRPLCWSRPQQQTPHSTVPSTLQRLSTSLPPSPSPTSATVTSPVDEKHDTTMTTMSAKSSDNILTPPHVGEVNESRGVIPLGLLTPVRTSSSTPRIHFLLLRPSYDTLVTDLSTLSHTTAPLSSSSSSSISTHQRTRTRYLQSRRDETKSRDRPTESEKKEPEIKREATSEEKKDTAMTFALDEDDLIAIEERLLKCTAGPLCLQPDPLVHRVANALHFRRNLWMLSNVFGQGLYTRHARLVPQRHFVHTNTHPFIDYESSNVLRSRTPRLLAMLQHAQYETVRRDEQEVFNHSAAEMTRRRNDTRSLSLTATLSALPRPLPPLRSRTMCFEINKGREVLQLDLQPHPHTPHTPTTGPFDHYITGKLSILRGSETIAHSSRPTESQTIEFVVGNQRQAQLFAQTIATIEQQQPGVQLTYDSGSVPTSTTSTSPSVISKEPPNVTIPPNASPLFVSAPPVPGSLSHSNFVPPSHPHPQPQPQPQPPFFTPASTSSLAPNTISSFTTTTTTNTNTNTNTTAASIPTPTPTPAPIPTTTPTSTPMGVECTTTPHSTESTPPVNNPTVIPSSTITALPSSIASLHQSSSYSDSGTLCTEPGPSAYPPANTLLSPSTETTPATNPASGSGGGDVLSSVSTLPSNAMTSEMNNRQKALFMTPSHSGANFLSPQIIASSPKVPPPPPPNAPHAGGAVSRGIQQFSRPLPTTAIPKTAPLSGGPSPPLTNIPPGNIVSRSVVNSSLGPMSSTSAASPSTIPPQLAYPPIPLRHSSSHGIVHSQSGIPLTTQFPTSSGGSLLSNQVVTSPQHLISPSSTSVPPPGSQQPSGGGTGLSTQQQQQQQQQQQISSRTSPAPFMSNKQ